MAAFEGRRSQANTNSPAEMELETTNAANATTAPPVMGTNPPEKAKKPRKSTTKRSKASVRQSPITKPQRRKTTTTPVMNAQALGELVENAEQNQDRSQQLPVPAIPTSMPTSTSSGGLPTDTDNNSSVSPENLNDASMEMPPPPLPKPKSARPSPRAGPEQVPAGANGVQLPGMPSPATPASLMKLSSPSNRSSTTRVSSQEPAASEHIENLELPESANFPKESDPSIGAAPSSHSPPEPGSAQSTTVPSLLSPVFPRPARAGTASASQSPQLASGPGTPSARRTPQLAPKGGGGGGGNGNGNGKSKKRASVGSAQVSPALRPKISPSIKPLLPSGGSNNEEDATSRLLAAKSNYQRILEGSTVPGVTYPADLSTNLTSKRTSHKIAEQGRRNRINSALQEIATLLPRPPPRESRDTEDEDGGDKKGSGGNGPSSKAGTVELAIEYIKQLKDEIAEANRRAEEAERKLEGGGKNSPSTAA